MLEARLRRAPRPASDSGSGSGPTGAVNFSQAVQIVASPGTSKTPESAMPRRARIRALQPSATVIRRYLPRYACWVYRGGRSL
jgi:hypothetical protein